MAGKQGKPLINRIIPTGASPGHPIAAKAIAHLCGQVFGKVQHKGPAGKAPYPVTPFIMIG
ncbi:MAG: hypothetical protein RIS85_1404, partial [Pseudomonadota bacterium]